MNLHMVFISPPGNKDGSYQVQQPLKTAYTIFKQKQAVIGCFPFQVYGDLLSRWTFLDQNKISVDQTFAIWPRKTINYPTAGVQVQTAAQ